MNFSFDDFFAPLREPKEKSHPVNDEKDLTPLAPSGISPWNHRAVVEDGCLALYWTSDSEHLRTFTREETGVLLNLLLASKDDIYI